MQHASWLMIALISVRLSSEKQPTYKPVSFGKAVDLFLGVLMAISPTDIRIIFTNYDIIAYFLNLIFCSEHFISIKHRILATFNINKTIQFWQPLSGLLIGRGLSHPTSYFVSEFGRGGAKSSHWVQQGVCRHHWYGFFCYHHLGGILQCIW